MNIYTNNTYSAIRIIKSIRSCDFCEPICFCYVFALHLVHGMHQVNMFEFDSQYIGPQLFGRFGKVHKRLTKLTMISNYTYWAAYTSANTQTIILYQFTGSHFQRMPFTKFTRLTLRGFLSRWFYNQHDTISCWALFSRLPNHLIVARTLLALL